MGVKTAIIKIKRAYHRAVAAWWVLLIIIGYSVLAWRFLGTSCLLASTVGIPCPGCGGTRAFFALLEGDAAASFRLHPMFIPFSVFIIIYAIVWLLNELIPRRMEIVLIALTIAAITLYAVRMIIMFPRVPPMLFNRQAILPRIVRLFWKVGI